MKHFSGGILLKPMLMYDQEIVKIPKMRKQIHFATIMSMNLLTLLLSLLLVSYAYYVNSY